MNEVELALIKSRLRNEHGLRTIPEPEYQQLRREVGYFVHSPEGREALKKNGFVHRTELKRLVGMAFKGFDCQACGERDRGGSGCFACRQVQNIIGGIT